MNFKELYEGAEPVMPGAPKGISIMTPQQFVAKAGDMPEEEGVAEGSESSDNLVSTLNSFGYYSDNGNVYVNDDSGDKIARQGSNWKHQSGKRGAGAEELGEFLGSKQGVAEGSERSIYKQAYIDGYNGKSFDSPYSPGSDEDDEYDEGWHEGHLDYENLDADQGVAEGLEPNREAAKTLQNLKNLALMKSALTSQQLRQAGRESMITDAINACIQFEQSYLQNKQQGNAIFVRALRDEIDNFRKGYPINSSMPEDNAPELGDLLQGKLGKLNFQQGVAEGQEHLDRIRKLSGLDEATKLPAQTRDLDSQEFQDYMKRIVGTPDLDKEGNVKVDKKGNEKYTTGKTAGDKYKMPYIHRSSVVSYLSPDGKSYDEDAVKKTLSIRPKALLKQNEKMKHSNGEFEQFFNVGFAALVGIALDEQTNKLIVVNTCPGAGSCKVDCFAMKGGKIQFKAAWQSDGRILTYLLNDPDGFFNQLSNEISVEAQAAAKGDKKFPNGWQTTVRWHDAGDFFSPEYLDMALKMAAKHPDVRFYAYTKMAGAALAQKPDNFIINWSEGANTAQEKQVKAKDPNLDTTKNSRIVPEKLFYDLLAKDEKGNLKKTDDGAWQPASSEALAEMKQRIAKAYGISVSSILSYTEYMAKRNSIPAGMKYNVIVAPGEGDVSANDPGVLSTLLLRH